MSFNLFKNVEMDDTATVPACAADARDLIQSLIIIYHCRRNVRTKMSEKETSRRKYVVDSGAIIKGLHLEQLVFGDSGEIEGDIFTIPEVIGEIRDQSARHLLESLPVSLKIREPSDESLTAVSEFARKTGDFARLSSVDLRVLALTYLIEKEVHGNVNHLRLEPKRTPLVVSTGGYLATSSVDKSIDEPSEQPTINSTFVAGGDGTVSGEVKEHETMEIEHTNGTIREEMAVEEEEGKKEEDEGEWITPNTLRKKTDKHKSEKILKSLKMRVACITTDFAMQNVLVQMGMILLSVDGVIIKNVRQYALKCDACKKVTLDGTRLFCPTCGNDALVRVSLSVTKKGTAHVYSGKSSRPRNLRGTQFSLPRPKGGRESGKNPILAEDQLLMGDKTRLRQMGVQLPDRSHKRDRTGRVQLGAFEESEFAPAHGVDLTVGKGAAYKRDHVIIGHPKKNPNERRRTTRSRRRKKS